MNAQFFINEIGCNFNLRKPKSEKPTNVYFVARVNENNTIVNEKINKLKLYFPNTSSTFATTLRK